MLGWSPMRWLGLAATDRGFGLGLLVSSFAFGFRHGIDWDHIAAITDIASSQDSPRKGFYFGTLYALGHAVIVFMIGLVAILAGENLPESVDATMGKIVGVTLLLLGVYVFYSLFRYGRDFRMRSRWMLVFSGVHRGFSWARDHMRRHRNGELELQHEHEHPSAEPFMHHEAEEESGASGARLKTRTHAHGHHHRVAADPFMNYGRATALGVGMIHGVGAETPTQVLIFLTAAGAGGTGAGIAVLAVFLVGLLAANSVIVLSSAYGFLAASKRFVVYATVAVITGVVSLVIGTIFVLGKETLLPALFGG